MERRDGSHVSLNETQGRQTVFQSVFQEIMITAV